MILQAVSIRFYALYLLALFAVESSSSQNYYGELSDIRMPHTTNQEMEEYIFEIDCNRFNSSLNFSNTDISTLGTDFINSPFIICLNFKKNKIISIASGAFDSLPALEYLNLAGNGVKSLFSFNGHNNLKALILSNQSNTNSHDSVSCFGKYPELRYLDLSGNEIGSIRMPSNDHYTFNRKSKQYVFPKLRYLDLSRNNFDEFDYSSLFNDNLMNLYLTNNNLYFINLLTYTNLVELKLDNNRFKSIKRYCQAGFVCLDNLPRLKYFSISNNGINAISEDVFINMPNLVTLDLSNNDLYGSFIELNYELASLETVYLDKNKLTSISMLHRLPNLSILSAVHNQLKKIGPFFVNAPILKKLFLGNNEMTFIDVDAFSKLEELEELHLDNNNLDNLPIGWSTNLINLRYLNMTNNNFQILESLSLRQSLSLINIYLINNPITHIKVEVLRNLPINLTIHLISQSENNTLFENKFLD
ncbi:hypothetical protein M0802_005809 [Mischocyttarus mexicanus]|nr:hypothetical protein M0802_005809 [Mischocyttarus mexicanus]